MECVIVHDLFLNETANYAHVFLPGSTFLEKGRHLHQCRTPHPARAQGDGTGERHGYDWEVTQRWPMPWGWAGLMRTRREIMDEIARLTPSFAGVSFERLDAEGSLQWPVQRGQRRMARRSCTSMASCAARASSSSPNMCRPTKRPVRASAAADHRAHPCRNTMSARRRGAPKTSHGTRRTCWRSIPRCRTARRQDGDWVQIASRAGETTLRALITDRVAPGVVYTTFHHPATQANVVTTDYSDWATNCPEYKVTAVQVMPVERPTDWQESAMPS
jgi:formate dehydrogenase major subunit